MVTLYLDKIFNPQSVAVIGASDEEGSVGYALMKNFIDLGFEGKIFPVNIRKTEILGLKAYPIRRANSRTHRHCSYRNSSQNCSRGCGAVWKSWNKRPNHN
ncbi:MAG: CoA-binding protein [Candidatus Bathyarchaeota archaeon]|nr:CoA-binding protein [Candidatus Bathyarchaeota archaeon]MDI6805046.1 CoA-binding protein [Candidatus Bathyarchaeia archaeon]